MGGGNLLAILSGNLLANVDAYAAERLGALERLRADAGDKESAARCVMVVAEGGCGSGYACEAPDPVTARSRMPKVSACDGTNVVYCVTHSQLRRTAQLAGILQWMGLSNDMSNPNFTPPTDAELIMAYFNKMMAKQRWQRAGAALASLRLLRGRMEGSHKNPSWAAAAAVASTPVPEDSFKRQPRYSRNKQLEMEAVDEQDAPAPPDSPTGSPVHARVSFSAPRAPRMSISFVQGDIGASSIAKRTMEQLPRPHDVREMLRNIAGQFCFVILDVRKDFILAACSEDCEKDMLASVAEDGTLFFGTDPDAMPENCTIMEFPKGTYFIGRYNGNGVDDLVFKRIAKVQKP